MFYSRCMHDAVLDALGGFDAAWDRAEAIAQWWENQIWPRPPDHEPYEALVTLVWSADSVRDDVLAPDLAHLLLVIGAHRRHNPSDGLSITTNNLHDQLAAAGLVTS